MTEHPTPRRTPETPCLMCDGDGVVRCPLHRPHNWSCFACWSGEVCSACDGRGHLQREATHGVACGICGGGIYFETCGINGCEYAVAGECQTCGERTLHQCPEHGQAATP